MYSRPSVHCFMGNWNYRDDTQLDSQDSTKANIQQVCFQAKNSDCLDGQLPYSHGSKAVWIQWSFFLTMMRFQRALLTLQVGFVNTLTWQIAVDTVIKRPSCFVGIPLTDTLQWAFIIETKYIYVPYSKTTKKWQFSWKGTINVLTWPD